MNSREKLKSSFQSYHYVQSLEGCFWDPEFHQKTVLDSGFFCSWEAGHGMRDIDTKRKRDAGFLQKGAGMRDIDTKRRWDVGFLQNGAGMRDQDRQLYCTLRTFTFLIFR